MQPDNYLHEQKDFRDLIQVVSGERRILPQLIEKDYWIMHVLYGLAKQGFIFELKGGTSLSKGYRIIERFSEDIDIRIEPPAELQVMAGKNHQKPAHILSRSRFFDWLAETIQIPGIESVYRDHEFDDEQFRGAGIRLIYPTTLQTIAGLKPGILLEVGFDDTTPNEAVDISSWALDKAATSRVTFTDNRALQVKCYHPAYTLVEKLQAVSTKFRQQQESGGFPVNFLRHYYDIYCLLADVRVQEFIGTELYHKRKEQRFRKEDVRCVSENEAFLLHEPAVLQLYKAEYAKTEGLYYAGLVSFEMILKRIRENFDRL
ncbi:MAG: nucleotidyl transferase AbiEii/AbiGii toxin family protein [Desulfuromonadaceae bacterium]